jgi:rhodanese-related sulfurtransferase
MDLPLKPLTVDLSQLDLRYLSGGIEAWKAAGKPVQTKGVAP